MRPTSGNREYPGGTGGVEATMAAYGYVHHCTLDPIRGAALTAAVELVAYSELRLNESDTARATRVQHLARIFERYLTGEEADGPTDP
jgi:hypothetical protein